MSKSTVRKGLLLSSVALVTLLLSTPLAQANYTGYGTYTEEFGVQSWEVWVKIIGEHPDGDIDGNGKVNIVDIGIIGIAFGSKPGDPNWDPRADVDGNGKINILDVGMVAVHFGDKAHTLFIKWKTNGDWPYSPFMYSLAQPKSYIKVWDEKGFSWSWGPLATPAHPLSGNITLNYPNTYTWAYTKIRWAYDCGFGIYYYAIVKVGVYVEG